MQSDMEGDDDDDDFSRHLRIVFPSMLFENLQVEDDSELLRPIIEAMYALSLSEDNTFSMISFDTIKSDSERREYTLTANIAQSVRIFGAAWDALLTVSPTRVYRVYADPYYDEIKGLAMMRIRVIVGSMMAPLRKTFMAYARRSRSITYSTLDRVIKHSTPQKEEGRNLSVEHSENANILSPREMALKQIYEDRRKSIHEMIRELREESRRMVPDTPSLDVSGPVINIDSQNSVISWRLPPRLSFDVEGLKVLIEKFPHLIIDTSICVKTEEVNTDEKGAGGSTVDVSLVIDFNFVPYHAIDIAITDSKTYLYMNEKSSLKGKDDTWLLDVDNTSSPRRAIHLPRPADQYLGGSEVTVKPRKYVARPKEHSKETVASIFQMSTRSSRQKSDPQVITMAKNVPKPSNLKRRRPEELIPIQEERYEQDNDGDAGEEETHHANTPPTLSSSTSTTLVFDSVETLAPTTPSSPQPKKRRLDMEENNPTPLSFFKLSPPDDPMETEKNHDYADPSLSSDNDGSNEDEPRSMWSRLYQNVRSTFWNSD